MARPLIKLIITIFLPLSLAQNYDFDSHFTIQLYHALDSKNSDSFTSRGNISVFSINTGELIVNQKELGPADKQGLAEIAKTDGFYRLKADVVGTDGVKTTFLTSSKACHLIFSQMNDILSINFDHNPTVIGIQHKSMDIDPFNEDCSKISSADIDFLYEYNTVINLRPIEAAPTPDCANFIQKIEKEREARERGDVKDNRSFISKYWMYIVPAVILLLVSSVTNPPEGGEAGSR